MTGGATGLVTFLLAACASPGPPAPIPHRKINWQSVTAFLDSAVARGGAPGAVLGVSYRGERFIHPTGQLGADDPRLVTPGTVYDLASVTKVVGLTTAAMLAVQDSELDLDLPVQQYIPAFTGPGKERVTVRMLLAHVGGLPAWRPLFREAATRDQVFALAESTPLEAAPETQDVYSDLGAIVLTQILESRYHERLDSLLERRVFLPLGMTSTRFLPPASWQDHIAPTELDPWRGRVLRGEVHDENAAAMDGVSGHAGLFSSVEDLLRFSEWAIAQSVGRSDGRTVGFETAGTTIIGPTERLTVRPSLIHDFTRLQNLVPGSSRALGWDTPSEGSSAGRLLSPRSFGHTGFTGTSLWIDPEHHLAIIILSNRVNPTRANPRWAPVRARIADLVMTTVFEDAP